ncbi:MULTISPECIES: murein hydrolase activator EnvC family protein [unclassified Campylobacter]|uniref:murein hydrolase activator EnvC family protein n=1 Tax=unclassified Campylobacter TaxID=2593542 RepID=UPI0022E9F666|nr:MULTISPECIES: peptidoglycan DD-metalloendopeptidase family protein [unclassified Campylobacter]MDA3079705.1 peptidoglycan DD-metalloendopeptidase family protein [Campylobacter sp. CS_NA2]MDA3081535.1 peptidoglycan DD-metalloendopeptidase family protein [Campylobacter sp. CS_NA1]MDA3085802.1 peptidoglycan DD-metalloendopeptidase family protein [Campylobacter sp. CS_ED1]MDA3090537.1 peptidoglycan DD-metalloendopeptidase family protein [Campylobacter sp. CS_ED2]WBR50681.1 peptidoglycan DD-meta
MKKILFLALALNLVFSAPNTKDKIEQTTQNLAKSQKEEKKLSQKIDEIADEILKEQNDAKKQDGELKELSKIVLELQEKHASEEKEIEKLNSQNAFLLNTQSDLENKIIDAISKELSFDLVSDINLTKSSDSIIADEVLNLLGDIMSNELSALMKDYENNKNLIDEQDRKIQTIKASMQDYNKKKDDLSQKRKLQEQKLANLKKNKDEYAKKLEKLSNEQDEIRKALEELKIINDKEEREKAEKAEKERLAKLEKERKKAEEKAKKEGKKVEEIFSSEPEPVIEDERVAKIDKKVKQYGSSYQASRVKKYTGAKTSAPLNGAFVKRNFGNYNDPVYNIKIFNENIVLGSKSSDTQVKSVLAGKVVFAKDTAVLDKVVILEHSGGIHTIYAHLSQIAPTIKVGSNIKKGYVLGRINSELTFEVTQQNYHINPLDLITLK